MKRTCDCAFLSQRLEAEFRIIYCISVHWQNRKRKCNYRVFQITNFFAYHSWFDNIWMIWKTTFSHRIAAAWKHAYKANPFPVSANILTGRTLPSLQGILYSLQGYCSHYVQGFPLHAPCSTLYRIAVQVWTNFCPIQPGFFFTRKCTLRCQINEWTWLLRISKC